MKIHFVGCAGVSMTALSKIAASRGHTVTGSDKNLNGHDERNVYGADLVVYTNAVGEDNVELRKAREIALPVIERAEYLGEVSKLYDKVIAVAGCHGKSTASAMLGEVFAPLSPTVHVGATGCSKLGGNKVFVTEACEYRRGFLHLSPDIGAVLNIGFDHPDCYKSLDDITDSYAEFVHNSKLAVVNGDDELCRRIAKNAVTFGLSSDNKYIADNIKTDGGLRIFDVISRGTRLARVKTFAVGGHNVYNALCAFAVAMEYGLKPQTAVTGLGKFYGIPRRFERKGIAFDKSVFTDYAHHPDEIKATVAAAKELFKTVAVVFQPHTYSRTKSLKAEFAAALGAADEIALTPIFPAREPFDPEICARDIAELISKDAKKPVDVCDGFEQAIDCAKNFKSKAIIFMGAGDIDKCADMFIKPFLKLKD